jgi:hypothetical protein
MKKIVLVETAAILRKTITPLPAMPVQPSGKAYRLRRCRPSCRIQNAIIAGSISGGALRTAYFYPYRMFT